MLKELHHKAWLQNHPDRTEEWLKDKLKNGFDIHHLDGDHFNNNPENLILVEQVDHMRLHGTRVSRWSSPFIATKLSIEQTEFAEMVYEYVLDGKFRWQRLPKEIQPYRSLIRKFIKENRLETPEPSYYSNDKARIRWEEYKSGHQN